MTGLTDVRDRTLTMLRALGIEPDPGQMRTVEPPGADCRLVCEQGCDEWSTVRRDEHGPFHLVNDDPADEPVQHRMTDNGQCNAVDWLRNDDAGIGDLGVGSGFEIARFPVRVSWAGDGYRWEKA